MVRTLFTAILSGMIAGDLKEPGTIHKKANTKLGPTKMIDLNSSNDGGYDIACLDDGAVLGSVPLSILWIPPVKPHGVPGFSQEDVNRTLSNKGMRDNWQCDPAPSDWRMRCQFGEHLLEGKHLSQLPTKVPFAIVVRESTELAQEGQNILFYSETHKTITQNSPISVLYEPVVPL
jgi:hypothetical protein